MWREWKTVDQQGTKVKKFTCIFKKLGGNYNLKHSFSPFHIFFPSWNCNCFLWFAFPDRLPARYNVSSIMNFSMCTLHRIWQNTFKSAIKHIYERTQDEAENFSRLHNGKKRNGSEDYGIQNNCAIKNKALEGLNRNE